MPPNGVAILTLSLPPSFDLLTSTWQPVTPAIRAADRVTSRTPSFIFSLSMDYEIKPLDVPFPWHVSRRRRFATLPVLLHLTGKFTREVALCRRRCCSLRSSWLACSLPTALWFR